MLPRVSSLVLVRVMSNHAGGVPEWMTHEYFQDIIRTSLDDDTVLLSDYQVCPGSAPGDNYACQIFRITMDFQQNKSAKHLSLIGKYLPTTDLMERLGKTYDMFGVEASMLSKTLPELYKRFADVKRFSPVAFFLDEEHKILYMNDLKEEGFVMKDKKNRALDLDHCRLVIRTMATLHAHMFLLQEENPQLKDKYLNVLWKKEDGGGFTETIIKSSMQSLMQVIDKWPIAEEQKKKLKALEGKVHDKFCDVYQRRDDSFNVLLHGDCWVNNMLFKYSEDGLVQDVILLDFQICNYNSIGLDLNYFLCTSAQDSILANHKELLIELYYETFVGITGEIEGFTLETVWKEFYERLTFGFACHLLFRAVIMQEVPLDLDSLANGEVTESNSELYLNDNFVRQLVNMLPFYEKHGVL